MLISHCCILPCELLRYLQACIGRVAIPRVLFCQPISGLAFAQVVSAPAHAWRARTDVAIRVGLGWSGLRGGRAWQKLLE